MPDDEGVCTPRKSLSVQIADAIRERIVAGDLEPGDLIPSERQIVQGWHVAKMTAARAVARLRAEGLVETVPGRGLAVVGDPRSGADLEELRAAIAEIRDRATPQPGGYLVPTEVLDRAASLLVDHGDGD